ncbi:MAG TPA: hypothetical protein ENH94_04835 [Phycisphaerales bacterium]|nr:hypothetical protein [Phycisphaerales bacterium]
MLIFKPSDAMLGSMGGLPSKYHCEGDWFMAYEWFCRKLIEFGGAKELMNATSSRSNLSFDPIRKVNTARDRIAYLLMHGWYHPQADEFLAFLGINKWEDLARPIALKGRRPQGFPNANWFKMRGRVFSYSPNSSHPGATWVQGFHIQFDDYRKRWSASIEYDYQHGHGSSWTVQIEQKYREHLNSFRERVDVWIEQQLIPEGRKDRERQGREQTWNRIHSAMDDLFYHDFKSDSVLDHEDQMADILVNADGPSVPSLHVGRIRITKSRLATLKRWATE